MPQWRRSTEECLNGGAQNEVGTMYNFSVGMFIVIGVAILFLGITAVIWLHDSNDLKNMSMGKYVWMHFLRVLIIFVIVWVGVMCFNAGQGSVISSPFPYSQQLRSGNVYTLLAEVKDRKSYILLVRSREHDFRAIRITGAPPPPRFRLVNGRPVAVTTATGK